MNISFKFLFVVMLCCLSNLSYGQSHLVKKIVSECKGCHTVERTKPNDGYFSLGLGCWQDQQCYGCHQEITTIAQNFVSGVKDKKFYAIPVSVERLTFFAKHSMSYLTAPMKLENKFLSHRLIQFLKQPYKTSGNSLQAPTMPSYASIDDEVLRQVITILGINNLSPIISPKQQQVSRGKSIWEKNCRSCHEGDALSDANPNYRKIAMLNSDWIYKYANQKIRTHNYIRQMPKLNITLNDAQHISEYLIYRVGKEYKEYQVQTQPKTDKEKKLEYNQEQFSQFLFTRFFHDAACAHCHSGKNRVRENFEASPDGLLRYIKEKGPDALLERLDNRRWEAISGFSHPKPGMPQTKDALPTKFISQLRRWIEEGCMHQGEKSC